MTRDTLPLPVADLSAFARALSRQLTAAEGAPSHLALMNMLARAGGFRNVQHLRAAQSAAARLEAPAPVPEPVDHTLVVRALNLFGPDGALRQWPARRNVQVLCLWALWSRLPRGEVRTERAFSAGLNTLHTFGDAALLRRDMVEMGLVHRTADCTAYTRAERQPPATARELIRHIARRL